MLELVGMPELSEPQNRELFNFILDNLMRGELKEFLTQENIKNKTKIYKYLGGLSYDWRLWREYTEERKNQIREEASLQKAGAISELYTKVSIFSFMKFFCRCKSSREVNNLLQSLTFPIKITLTISNEDQNAAPRFEPTEDRVEADVFIQFGCALGEGASR